MENRMKKKELKNKVEELKNLLISDNFEKIKINEENEMYEYKTQNVEIMYKNKDKRKENSIKILSLITKKMSQIENCDIKSVEKHLTNPYEIRDCEVGNFSLYGGADKMVSPFSHNSVKNGGNIPIINLGIDTEYQYIEDSKNRHLITIQISFTLDNINFYNFIFVNLNTNKISIFDYVQHVVRYLDKELNYINENKIHLNFIFHNSNADLTLFKEFKDIAFNNKSKQIGSTLSVLGKIRKKLKYMDRNTPEYVYNITYSINDTMNYSGSSKSKSLKELSKNNFFGKIEYDNSFIDKENMLDSFIKNPYEFLLYSTFDSLSTLEITINYFGINKTLPATISQESATLFYEYLCFKYGISNNDINEFNRIYKNTYDTNRIGLVKKKNFYRYEPSWEVDPLWDDAFELGKRAYCGGLNQCFFRGFVEEKTYDYDKTSAYPSVMCLCPTLDFSKDPIYLNLPSVEQCLGLFPNKEINLNLALVDFDFSKVKDEYKIFRNKPFLPVNKLGSLIFPIKAENVNLSGMELYKALKIGAVTKVKKFVYIPTLKITNEVGYELDISIFSEYLKGLKIERSKHTKNSPQNEYYKLMMNGLYGKICQGLTDAKYNKFERTGVKREVRGPSKITNSIYASFITSGCRYIMSMSRVYLEEKGYKVYSITTDGFISNAPLDVVLNILDNEDMKYLHNYLIAVNKYLLNDKENTSYYEIKHSNDKFFNIATRGNVSINDEGVYAKMGSSFKGSRDEFLEALLKNKFKLNDSFYKATNIKKILYKNEDYDFNELNKIYNFEYDFKNKPDISTIEEIELNYNGNNYLITNFWVEPFEDENEFLKFKTRVNEYNKINTNLVTHNKNSLLEFINKNNITDNLENRYVKNTKDYNKKQFLILYFLDDVRIPLIIKTYFKKLKRNEILNILNSIKYGKEIKLENYKKIKTLLKRGEIKYNLEHLPIEYIKKIEEKIINIMKG